jgi:hypothetical protein
VSRTWAFLVSVGTAIALASGCVSDPTVEDEVPPTVGALETDAGTGGHVGAADACQKLVEALTASRTRLGCSAAKPEPVCPSYVAVGGALPCDELYESSLDACVSKIGKYASCDDFDRTPCVVAVVTASCHAALPASDAGRDATAPDGALDAGDAAPGAEAGPDGSTGSDASTLDASDSGPG